LGFGEHGWVRVCDGRRECYCGVFEQLKVLNIIADGAKV
jgi:hypothetical protein